MHPNTFNLIDSDWIKVVNAPRISLWNLFSNLDGHFELGGNAVEKIVVFRLLLAIAQAACPIANKKDWSALTVEKMASQVLDYLRVHHDAFDIYSDENPFLQKKEIHSQKAIPISHLNLGINSGNTTILMNHQIPQIIDAQDIVYVLLEQVIYPFGGKKADLTIALDGIPKKGSAPFGTAVGARGYLHSFIKGRDLLESINLNLLTSDEISTIKTLPAGLGVAPWEEMPGTESDAVAKKLSESYMGRLIPLDRFCRIDGEYLHLTTGVKHPAGLSEGVVDLSVTITKSAGKFKAIWANPEKAPWRDMHSILAFLNRENEQSVSCMLLDVYFNRNKQKFNEIGIWSGGIKLSSNAGEQYAAGKDDFVEYLFITPADKVDEGFYDNYVQELSALERLSKTVYGAVCGFYSSLGSAPNIQKLKASNATSEFWNSCSALVPELVQLCVSEGEVKFLEFRKKIETIVHSVYVNSCPALTSRQIIAQAQNSPNTIKYLKERGSNE